MPVDLGVAVRPVRLPPGRLAGDEGGRRAAQPVRRPRACRSAREAAQAGPDLRATAHQARHGSAAAGAAGTAGRPVRQRRPAERSERVRPPPVGRGLPQLRERRAAAEPGVTTLVGLNGQGKTNLVEAIGYLATLGSRTGSPPTPRWSGSAPTRRWSAARWCATGASRCSSSRSTPGRANRARLNRSPLPRPRDVLGTAAHGALRARGPRAGQGRPVRAAPVPRRPAGAAAAAAAPACAPTTTGCSSSATPC